MSISHPRNRGANLPVVDGITQVPRYPIEPTINGSPAGVVRVDTVSGTFASIRAVINPGDDLNAAKFLAEMTNGAKLLYPGRDYILTISPDGSDGDIAHIYLLPIADAGTATAGIINSSVVQTAFSGFATTVGKAASANISEAQIMAASPSPMVHYEFAAGCRHVRIGISDAFSSNHMAWINVEGADYE